MAKPNRRFTIFDTIDFPRAPFAEYPKMLYHPEGATRVTNPGEEVATLSGVQLRNRQETLITQVVNNKAEEEALLAQGWRKKKTDPTVKAKAKSAA